MWPDVITHSWHRRAAKGYLFITKLPWSLATFENVKLRFPSIS
jgi:hypothetical protein